MTKSRSKPAPKAKSVFIVKNESFGDFWSEPHSTLEEAKEAVYEFGPDDEDYSIYEAKKVVASDRITSRNWRTV